MKIAHFSDTNTPSRNGIATSIQTLTRSLATLGCSSITISPGPSWTEDQRNSDSWHLRSIPTLLADLRLPIINFDREVALLSEWGPDLVHVHTPGPTGLLGMLAARKLDIPLVQTYHTDLHSYADAYHVPTWTLRVILSWYRRKLGGCDRIEKGHHGRAALIDAANALMLGEADAVIIPTEAVLRRRRLPVRPETLRVLPTPANRVSDPGGNEADSFRSRFGIAASAKVVLFVGRIHDEKDITLLLSAFGKVAVIGGPLILVLVGPVYGKRKLARSIQKAGVEMNVVLTGPLSPEAVWTAYDASDVFVLPSVTDTQGIVLDEAVLAGLPVVLVDADLYATHPLAMAMYLTAPEPGQLADGITEALSAAPDQRSRSDVAGLIRAYAPAVFGVKVLSIYESLLALRKMGRLEKEPAANGCSVGDVDSSDVVAPPSPPPAAT